LAGPGKDDGSAPPDAAEPWVATLFVVGRTVHDARVVDREEPAAVALSPRRTAIRRHRPKVPVPT
jgi:hypothetical protein